MSILNWVRNGKLGIKQSNSPTLPNPLQIADVTDARITAICNEEVKKVDCTPF